MYSRGVDFLGNVHGNKPKVFLIGGFPGAGKSCLTKVSDDYLHSQIITVDDVYEDMRKENFLWRNDDRVLDRVHDIAVNMLQCDSNVMIDSVYMDRESRLQTINALKDIADVYMILVDTPVEICKERNAKRVNPVEDWVYENLTRDCAFPSLEEGFIGIYRFDNRTSLEKQECITGAYGLQDVLTDTEQKIAIQKAEAFLHDVAKDSGVIANKDVPSKFEEMVSSEQITDMQYT